MAEPFIRLDGISGNLYAVLLVAAGARGDYRFKLWDERGRDPELKGAAVFDGQAEFRHLLDSSDELRGHTLTWSVRVAPKGGANGGEYRALVRIVDERNTPIRDGEFVYAGPLDEMRELPGLVHFEPA